MSSAPRSTASPGPTTRAPDDDALRFVSEVAKRSGSSFYYAFLTLPKPRREAILAVYAFCHAVDDAVDEASSPDEASANLDVWRAEIERVFEDRPQGAIGEGLVVASRRFDLPRELFDEVIAGVAQDVAPRRIRTWDELEGYCDLVAGAVGRLCVRIFGRRDERADAYAHALGCALQLTNILRDLEADARIGRFYLPTEDLARFGVSEAEVLAGPGERRDALLHYEAERARAFFARADDLGRPHRRQLYAAEIMGAVYADLLRRVAESGFPVDGTRVRVPKSRKLMLAIRTYLRCMFA